MSETIPLIREALETALADKVAEVRAEPEYSWGDGTFNHMTTDGGDPFVRVALGNCGLDTDLWEGIRGPSRVGLYPLGLPDIWAHYAANNIRNVRRDGSPNPLAMPETYEEAKQQFGRAAIVSAMLPLNPEVFAAYADHITAGKPGPLDAYCKARADTQQVIHRALGKLALSLLSPDRAVVLMTPDKAGVVADRTRAEYQRGKYHGPTVELFSQPSVAVLTGLLQWGVCRIPIRDEVDGNGTVRRLVGQYGTIVVFDREQPVHDPPAGVVKITPEWRQQVLTVSDYTDVDDATVARRYCTYNDLDDSGNSLCGECLKHCPSGAQANSTPSPTGEWSDRILSQKHRFHDGWLKFDGGNCCRDRGQKGQLYADYVCARCEVVCAALGARKPASALEAMLS